MPPPIQQAEQQAAQPEQQGDEVLAGPRGSTAAALETSHKVQVESLGLHSRGEPPREQEAPPPERVTEVG